MVWTSFCVTMIRQRVLLYYLHCLLHYFLLSWSLLPIIPRLVQLMPPFPLWPGIWSWSLLQFTLVLTASRARKPRLGMDSPRSSSLDGPSCEEWADMDIIAIVCTVILQDGPFLLLRSVKANSGSLEFFHTMSLIVKNHTIRIITP